MAKLLDFEKEEKGYKQFYPTRDNIKNNIGKMICYVDRIALSFWLSGSV